MEAPLPQCSAILTPAVPTFGKVLVLQTEFLVEAVERSQAVSARRLLLGPASHPPRTVDVNALLGEFFRRS